MALVRVMCVRGELGAKVYDWTQATNYCKHEALLPPLPPC